MDAGDEVDEETSTKRRWKGTPEEIQSIANVVAEHLKAPDSFKYSEKLSNDQVAQPKRLDSMHAVFVEVRRIVGHFSLVPSTWTKILDIVHEINKFEDKHNLSENSAAKSDWLHIIQKRFRTACFHLGKQLRREEQGLAVAKWFKGYGPEAKEHDEEEGEEEESEEEQSAEESGEEGACDQADVVKRPAIAVGAGLRPCLRRPSAAAAALPSPPTPPRAPASSTSHAESISHAAPPRAPSSSACHIPFSLLEEASVFLSDSADEMPPDLQREAALMRTPPGNTPRPRQAEESEPKAAAPKDAPAESPEGAPPVGKPKKRKGKSNSGAPPEGAPPEGLPHTEPFEAESVYIVQYDWDEKVATRRLFNREDIKRRKETTAESTDQFAMPDDPEPEKPMLAIFPDGTRLTVPDYTVSDYKLAKEAEVKKSNVRKSALWVGCYMSKDLNAFVDLKIVKRLDGTKEADVHTERDKTLISLQHSLMNKAKGKPQWYQVCNIRISLMISEEVAIHLLTDLAKELQSGETTPDSIYDSRNEWMLRNRELCK